MMNARQVVRSVKPQALILTRYGQLGASSRIRLLQMIPFFETLMAVRVQKFLPDRYIKAVNKRHRVRALFLAALGIFRRLLFLLGQIFWRRRYDVVIVEQELIPFCPTRLELLLVRRLMSGSLIIDIDDGNHLRYERLTGIQARLCGNKFQAIWNQADLIVCGSGQLVKDVSDSGVDRKKVVLIPSVPSEANAMVTRSATTKEKLIIGWIGSPSTAPDLALVWQPLQQVAKEFPLEIHIVGAEVAPVNGLTVRNFPWSPKSEAELLSRMDLGIMPLTDSEFRRRKCGFKIIQYMSAGIPVIASDVGGNRWIMIEDHRIAGYVAETADEWLCSLQILLGNEELRKQCGEDGVKIARGRFSLPVAQDQWKESLQSLPNRCIGGISDD